MVVFSKRKSRSFDLLPLSAPGGGSEASPRAMSPLVLIPSEAVGSSPSCTIKQKRKDIPCGIPFLYLARSTEKDIKVATNQQILIYTFLYSNNRYSFLEKFPAYSFPKIYFSIPVNSSMYFCGVISCSLT